MKAPQLTVYQDSLGEWRWRLKTANGRTVADSGEGYSTLRSATRAAHRLCVIAPKARLAVLH